MSKNIDQVYIANPITSNAATDLMYFGQSPYGAGNDAAMTYANFATQFALSSAIISPAHGGTGVANNAANTQTFSGNYGLTWTLSNTTALTLPTSGTLATTAQLPSFPLAASLGGTGVNNGSSTLTLGGNLTTSGAFASTFTMTGATTVTFPTTGTLATTTNDTIIGAITQFPIAGGDAYLTGSGWLKCDGSVVSQSTYASLFTKVGAAKTIGTTWTPANRTVLAATTFFGAATDGSGSLYAIFGTGGVVYSSTDLVTFTSRTSNTGSQLRCGTYATSKFVLAGAGGAVITSTDAITWSVRTSNTGSQLENVLFLNSLFVGVGAGGAVITSTDAITWVARTSGTSTGLLSVGYGNGLYFSGGTNVVIKSTDAITWSTIDTTALPNTQFSGQYQYFANKYFMSSNSQVVTTSTDLVTFSQKVLAYGAPGNMNATFVSNSLLCVLSAAGVMYTTTDLVTWDWVSTSYQFSAAGISVAVDSTHIVMANNNGSVNYTSGAAYSYNSATSFILPNLQSPGVIGLSVGSSFGGTLAYYIKAL